MVNSGNEQSDNNQDLDQNLNGGDLPSSDNVSSTSSGSGSITRRLAEILVEGREGDLVIDRSEVLQWIQALDMQVMGACRTDERLKPLLKLNVSADAAEDRLLAQLSQHFEPSEIGILTRCLCIPLVTIRVGKINKQGALLCPTSIRGSLNLTILPTSDLSISFNGDDGCIERLATLSGEAQCSAVEIEEILADKSRRSFLVKFPAGEISYFWCSEKSKLLGDELLRKMKDLLMTRPSLAELTGISESRLSCFAIQLRAYLAGSLVTTSLFQLVTPSLGNSDDPSKYRHPQSSLTSLKTSRFRQYGSQASKTNPIYQGSLSPKSSSFKDGSAKDLLRSEEKRRRGESYIPCFDNSLNAASPSSTDPSSAKYIEEDKLSEESRTQNPSTNSFNALGSFTDMDPACPETQLPSTYSSRFSPHYCWCPPVASALQYTAATSQLPISLTESLSLPPLSSLLSTARQSKQPLNLADIPPLDFPPLVPDAFVRLPLNIPTSQQIPTFTPLMCDPIVHVPVIDVFSSGQGYLVSAGPAISTVISPLNPNLVDPLIPNAESMVEKGARETLRMLINGSNQSTPTLLDVLPSVLTSSENKQNVLALGSRGLYTGTRDVNAITNGMPTFGFISLPEKLMADGIGKRSSKTNDLFDKNEMPSGSASSGFHDCCTNMREESAD